jgi:hypothetical protein
MNYIKAVKCWWRGRHHFINQRVHNRSWRYVCVVCGKTR